MLTVMAEEQGNRRFCPHCSTLVSKSTFYHHKSLYYVREKDSWSEAKESTGYDCGSTELNISFESELDCEDLGPSPCKVQNLSKDCFEDESIHDLEAFDSDSTFDDDSECEAVDGGNAELWESESDLESDSDTSSPPVTNSALRICHTIAAFILTWQYRFALSDNAISALLSFLRIVFLLVNKAVGSPILDDVVFYLPTGVSMCRKLLKIDNQLFRKYACCIKCCEVYSVESCIDKVGSIRSSKCCSHISYPKHPREAFRQPCGARLMKEVKTRSKSFFYPFKTFCYKSITDSLRELCSRSGFLEKCEQWRQRKIDPNTFYDVYDGCVWKDFQSPEKNFFTQPHNLGLMLNVDWFQPYEHTQYSVGVVYLAIMNLPRSERFLPHNVIICSIIPGPSEPKYNINPFLKDMVEELKELWKGIFFGLPTAPLPVRLRAALLCVAADIPATRKVCGFTSHNSSKGCSKCLKTFNIIVGQQSDYGGYDRISWELRTNENHRECAERNRFAKTKTSRVAIEHDTGVRYSILNELHYFDCVRFHVIDPMHNLLLGTAKHVMNLWIKRGIITTSHFEKIQVDVDSFSLPRDIGRIPYKISSGFASFKADQWRSWIVIYSPVVLKEVLPMEDYAAWSLFVKACCLLCTRSISQNDLDTADTLLLNFCSKFEQLYGGENTTMNMHLHCHLKRTILDYGPVYAYWLFSFERFNGILGGIPTNNRTIEEQLMKRFVCDQQLQSDSITKVLNDNGIQKILSSHKVIKGSVRKQISSCNQSYCPLGPITEESFDKEDCDDIVFLFSQREPISNSIKCSRIYHKIKAVIDEDCVLGSLNSRRIKSSNVFAKKDGAVRVCQILHFCEVHLSISHISGEDTQVKRIVALVRWYQRHPEQGWFSPPALIFCKFFDPCHSFICLNDIQCVAATCVKSVQFSYGEESVLCVVPLENHSHMYT